MGLPSSSLYSGSLKVSSVLFSYSIFKFYDVAIFFARPITMTTYFDPYSPESGNINRDPERGYEARTNARAAAAVLSTCGVVHMNMPILVGQTEPCEAEKVAREDAETSESTRSVHMVGI